MVVRGPIAMRVIVSAGSVSRIRRISRYDGEDEGVKRFDEGDVEGSTEAAVAERRVPGGGVSNK